MVEVPPTDSAGQFARWQREVMRRLGNLETMRRTPYTEIYDEDGELLGKLSADGLQFFDVAGNVVTDFDGDGIAVLDASGNVVSGLTAGGVTVYDGSGNPLTTLDDTGVHVFDGADEITTIDDDGLTVSNAAGVAQLRAGNLDGAGDYGVEIGGGRARAFDIDFYDNTAASSSLTTTPSTKVSVNVVPPSWATRVYIFAWLTFEMTNGTAGVQRQRYRIDIDGEPGTGFFNNDVEPGKIQNVTDVMRHALNGPFGSGVSVEGIAGVDTGTNSNNFIRLHVFAWHTRT